MVIEVCKIKEGECFSLKKVLMLLMLFAFLLCSSTASAQKGTVPINDMDVSQFFMNLAKQPGDYKYSKLSVLPYVPHGVQSGYTFDYGTATHVILYNDKMGKVIGIVIMVDSDTSDTSVAYSGGQCIANVLATIGLTRQEAHDLLEYRNKSFDYVWASKLKRTICRNEASPITVGKPA